METILARKPPSPQSHRPARNQSLAISNSPFGERESRWQHRRLAYAHASGSEIRVAIAGSLDAREGVSFTGNQLITMIFSCWRAGAFVPTPPATDSKWAPPDAQPFWSGVNGKLEMDLKKVIYVRLCDRGIRGSAVVTDTRFALDSLEAFGTTHSR